MSIFDWQDEYSVDNGMIDDQHKELLRIAEALFNAVLSQIDEAHLEKSFETLLNYTKKHFSDELNYFEENKALGIINHASEHDQLSEELIAVWDKERLGFQSEKGRILLNWVEERLLPHMMIDDQKTYQSIKN